MAENNLIYIVLVVLAVLIFNPGLTGNFNYSVASSYGPSETDKLVAPGESGRIVVIPSFRHDLGEGSITADAETCIGDAKSSESGRIGSLTDAANEALHIADTACYYECLRYGGSISPLFGRQPLESAYPHSCSKVRTSCFCTI